LKKLGFLGEIFQTWRCLTQPNLSTKEISQLDQRSKNCILDQPPASLFSPLKPCSKPPIWFDLSLWCVGLCQINSKVRWLFSGKWKFFKLEKGHTFWLVVKKGWSSSNPGIFWPKEIFLTWQDKNINFLNKNFPDPE